MYKDKFVAYMIWEAVNQDTNIRIISDSNRCVKFEADLQDTSEWNRNKRKYPTDVVKKGLMRENVQEPLANGDWCGKWYCHNIIVILYNNLSNCGKSYKVYITKLR